MASSDGFSFKVDAVDKSGQAFRSMAGRARQFGTVATAAITAPFRALSSMKLFAFTQNIQTLGRMLSGTLKTMQEWTNEAQRAKAVSAEFSSYTGVSGDKAYILGRRLQEAARGALNLDNTLEMANRSLALGLDTKAIEGIFEFAAIKAKTTREEFSSIVQGMMTGLATGRVMTLQRVGLLRQGMEGVARTYEEMTGLEWKSLSVASRNAFILKQALEEMGQAVEKSGLAGDKTPFNVDRLAAAMDDIQDTIKDIIVNSPTITKIADSMREVAYSFRDVVSFNFDKLVKVFDVTFGSLARTAGFQLKGLAGLFGNIFKGDAPVFQRITEFFAKLPVYVNKAFLTIQKWVVDFGKRAAQGFAWMMGGLAKVANAGGALFGYKLRKALVMFFEEGQKRLFDFSTQLGGTSVRVNHYLNQTNYDLRDIDDRLKDINTNTEEHRKRQEKLLDRTERWRGVVGDIGQKWRALFGKDGQAGSAANLITSIAGRLRMGFEFAGAALKAKITEAFDAAKTRVDDLTSQLKDAMATRRQVRWGIEQSRFERSLTGLPEFAQNEQRYFRALSLMERARTEKDIEWKRTYAEGSMADLGILSSREQNPFARKQIEKALLAAEEMRVGIESGRISSIQDALRQANAGLSDASRAYNQMQWAERWQAVRETVVKPLKDTVQETASVVGDFNGLVGGMGHAMRQALFGDAQGSSASSAAMRASLAVTGGH